MCVGLEKCPSFMLLSISNTCNLVFILECMELYILNSGGIVCLDCTIATCLSTTRLLSQLVDSAYTEQQYGGSM